MKGFSTWILSIFLLFAASAVSAGNNACVTIIKADDLVCKPKLCPGVLHAGNGVSFRLSPGVSPRKLMGPSGSWLRIIVLDGNNPVRELPDSFYLGYGHLRHDKAHYVMIGEYTGGMHCCTRNHFFVRPAPGRKLRYLGTTAESDEGLDEKPFSCVAGKLYLEEHDMRFQSFHTPYAQSLLSLPTHYRLTPSAITIDNLPFHKKYIDMAGSLSVEIEAGAAKRQTVPDALIIEKDGEAYYADEPAQLIVKRAILYLFAREEAEAWKNLENDMKKYYRQATGLDGLKKEIISKLKEAPY
ncbi:MAG: hypothetical protein HY888_00655 [Deltaproteobacteria bacterium]|nr:hypothetical protein [Deltaproteobacteria bacterium]